MPINYSTEGYKLQPQFADLSRLQGGVLQPLDVTRKISVEYRPLEKLVIPSSQPELVTNAIIQAGSQLTGGILGGIESAFKEKKEIEKENRKFEQDKELYNLKYNQDANDEDKKFNLQKRVIDYRNSVNGVKERTPAHFVDEETENQINDEVSSVINPPLPEQQPDFNDPPSGTESVSLFSVAPIDIPQQVSDVANQLKGIDAKYLSADTSGAIVAPVQSQEKKLDLSIPLPAGYEEAHKALQNLTSEQVKPKTSTPVPGPFRSLKKAQEEAAKTYDGYEPLGTVKERKLSEGGGYYVDRPAMRQESLEASEARKQSLSVAKQNTLNREQVNFNNHADIKAFTAQNGMRQSIGKFVRDYDAIAKNPEASGISDIGLLDMFARAEGGGRVTEGQAHLVLNAMGLLDKAKQLGMKLEGGDKLSQNQRDQMLRVISEDHVSQANIANQQVEMARRRLKSQGVTNEDDLPQPFILPQTKWEAESEIAKMKSEAFSLNDHKKQLLADGMKDEAKKIDEELKLIGEKAISLRKKIDKSKSAIINLNEMETTPQGWGGGSATILMQQ